MFTMTNRYLKWFDYCTRDGEDSFMAVYHEEWLMNVDSKREQKGIPSIFG